MHEAAGFFGLLGLACIVFGLNMLIAQLGIAWWGWFFVIGGQLLILSDVLEG